MVYGEVRNKQIEAAVTTMVIVCGCLDLNIIYDHLWRTMDSRTTVVVRAIASLTSAYCIPSSSILVMAESSRFLRALRRIVDTTRKTSQNPRPMPTLQNTPSVLTSLPEHKSLLPLLLSFDIPSKLAKACSDRYDGYVGQLKLETEIKLAPYLSNRKKSHPAQAYSLFLNNYNQTLQLWSHSILNAALVSLKRDSVELRDLEVTYPAPLWLPVCFCALFSLGHADDFVATTCPGFLT